MGSLQSRLGPLRARLDALRDGRPSPAGFWERVGGVGGRATPPALDELDALDAALDRVGIHTAPDAQLLRSLELEKGRASALARNLEAQAQRSLKAYEVRLRWLESARERGTPKAGELSALERWYAKLARVLKVADIFALPKEAPPVPFELLRPARPATRVPPNARLAVAQFFAERARRNATDVVQKRRDLDLAHELLLRLGSEPARNAEDRGILRGLRSEVAARREQVRTAPATRSVADLLRFVRSKARREPGEAYRALRGLYERALEAGDARLAEAAHGALGPLAPPRETLRQLLQTQPERELRAWLGAESGVADDSLGSADETLTELAFALTEGAGVTFELAAGCARYFDVEDALGEEVEELDFAAVRPSPVQVPYPTQTLTFETTSSLSELPGFVIEDPRRLLYDLASSRQRVRAYLQDAPPPRPQQRRRTAVRVYVCDASGSMQGARARFRDALILAELNNLRLKARRREPFDPLYFSFFNDSPTHLARVDTAVEAARQMQKLFDSSPAEGLTNITIALTAAFDSIRSAQGKDPYLARATVVLVTDGEDRVDLELLRQSRAPVDSLDIALSFISLGEENKDLRGLVDEQRQRGGRAFYTHLSDGEIATARTDFDVSFRTLWPDALPVSAEALAALRPQLDALERVARGEEVGAVSRPTSFETFFPAAPRRSAHDPSLLPRLARVEDILTAVGEAASLVGPQARAAESVALLEHLLHVYQLSVKEYLACLSQGATGVTTALERVRLLARPLGSG